MSDAVALIMTILMVSISAQPQHASQDAKPEEPLSTTVCEILKDPSAFNNKLVQVRGYVSINFEYSILQSESCHGEIWFALADSSGPPGLLATVPGSGTAGEKDSNGHWTQPISVKLNRDADFEMFESYLTESAKVKPYSPCGRDCHLYQVAATFTGRIDAVSEKIHAAHLKRPPSQSPDFKGFGHMGLFDAELVVQSVKEVVAIELTHAGKTQPKPE